MKSVQVFDQPEVVIPAEAVVGEGPVFDQRTGRLCWVDITEGWIHESDLAAGRTESVHLDTIVGAVAPRESEPGFAVAVSDGFGFVVGSDLTISDPVLADPHRRMNDAKCDSAGRLWAGSTHLEFVPGAGALHRWDGSSRSVELASGFTLPNGLGWSPDDRTMYLVDSFAGLLLQADYEPDEGLVGDFGSLCTIAPGLPDGLTVAADGTIWVAVWEGTEVRRFSPDGQLIGIVPMPVSRVTSCAFGADGTLYITTARFNLTDEPLAGSVFALATNAAGVPVSPFRG